MSNRFVLLVAGAFILVFALGVAAVVGVTNLADRVPTVADTVVDPPAAVPAPPPEPTFARFSPQVQPPAVMTAPVPQATGRSVADSDLIDLAAAVKLGQNDPAQVNKDVWAHELPVARGLLGSMCDCDQRNWLNHFVQAGQEAVAGSSHYPESVRLLASLHRSDLERSRSVN